MEDGSRSSGCLAKKGMAYKTQGPHDMTNVSGPPQEELHNVPLAWGYATRQAGYK